MSINISYYSISKVEDLNDITDLDKEIAQAQKKGVNLEKFTEDLAMIFSNSINPFSDKKAMYYRMLFGNHVSITTAEYRQIGGFIPASEIPLFITYISDTGLNKYENFSDIFENLSSEVKQELVELDSPDKKSLFNDFLKPLTDLYFDAHKEGKAIVICGS